jgi:hypothetical protein
VPYENNLFLPANAPGELMSRNPRVTLSRQFF